MEYFIQFRIQFRSKGGFCLDDNIIRDYKEAVHEISKAYYFINNDESDAVYGQDVYNKSIKQYPYFFIHKQIM